MTRVTTDDLAGLMAEVDRLEADVARLRLERDSARNCAEGHLARAEAFRAELATVVRERDAARKALVASGEAGGEDG
jgi:hypothetical protein